MKSPEQINKHGLVKIHSTESEVTGFKCVLAVLILPFHSFDVTIVKSVTCVHATLSAEKLRLDFE